jgi:hypothetical protein
MKCKFEHIFNTNSFSEFLPPFHETSRMYTILYIHENSKKKLQDCNSQDIYKTLNIMNKNIKEHPTGFMKWRQKLGKKAQTDFIQNTVNRDIKENSKRFWS